MAGPSPLSAASSDPSARRAGVLLHPTSFPGGPVGDLGEEAHRFVDWLAHSGQTLWQVLPLSPTGPDGSPYSGESSVATNPLLIALEDTLDGGPDPTRVDFARAARVKRPLLEAAFERLRRDAKQARDLEDFIERELDWLEDYALFMALKEEHAGSFTAWPKALLRREPAALQRAARRLEERLAFHRTAQFVFWQQWDELHRHARERGVCIVGDMPFYVAQESADVWACPELFDVDPDTLLPRHVGGVPPDRFSAGGQRWGSPVYDWRRMEAESYRWWVRRFRKVSELVDIVRIDHFRGFEACWNVPASEPDAVRGEWVPTPGRALFDAVLSGCPGVRVWAEDLGLITPAVDALREDLGFPGMRVLQFAFDQDDGSSIHLPFRHVPDSVVYTGTHDNDTTVGWWNSLTASERDRVRKYLDHVDPSTVHWQVIRAAYGSVARDVIVPLQDVLGQDTEARMNVPGQPGANWTWRYREHALTTELGGRLLELSRIYGRLPRGASLDPSGARPDDAG